MTGVSLDLTVEPVGESNFLAACTLRVHPSQERFVGRDQPIAAMALYRSNVKLSSKVYHPYLVLQNGVPAGFFVLALDPMKPKEMWVFHFFVDRRFQGKGVGTRAMEALLREVPSVSLACRSLHLTVHPDNVVAQKLYRSQGFAMTREKVGGLPLWILNLP